MIPTTVPRIPHGGGQAHSISLFIKTLSPTLGHLGSVSILRLYFPHFHVLKPSTLESFFAHLCSKNRSHSLIGKTLKKFFGQRDIAGLFVGSKYQEDL